MTPQWVPRARNYNSNTQDVTVRWSQKFNSEREKMILADKKYYLINHGPFDGHDSSGDRMFIQFN